MRFNLTKHAAIAAMLAAPLAANAALVTVDGIDVEPGAQFITTSLWESVLNLTTGRYQDDVLSGVGIVTQIDNTAGSGTTWISGQNNRQLTYFFTGYSVSAWYDSFGVKHSGATLHDLGFNLATKIDFTGGSVNIYSDLFVGGTRLNPSGPASYLTDIANATDGALWLSLIGHSSTFLDPNLLVFRTGTLLGDVDAANSIHLGNKGIGYLDVVGGDAAGLFNTNSWDLGPEGKADTKFEAKVSTTNCSDWPLCGTASLKTQSVPEPGSMALFGIGLAGFAVSRLRRKS
jgi:hypothetical protein